MANETMRLSVTSKEIKLPNGVSVAIGYDGVGKIESCVIIPNYLSESYSASGEPNSFWVVDNRIITYIRDNKITVIDIEAETLEKRLFAYDCEYEYCSDGEGYLITKELSDDKNIKFFCPRHLDKLQLNADTLLKLLNLEIQGIFTLKDITGGNRRKIGLVTSTTTEIYYPEFGGLASEEDNELKGKIIVGIGYFNSENIFLVFDPQKEEYYTCSLDSYGEHFHFHGPFKYFSVGYVCDDSKSVPYEHKKPFGFVFVKTCEIPDKMAVYAVNNRGRAVTSFDLYNYPFFGAKKLNLSCVRRLYNISGEKSGPDDVWDDYDTYFLGARANDIDSDLFKIRNLTKCWNIKERKIERTVIARSALINRNYPLNSFCQYQSGSKWDGTRLLDFCSLIYVADNDSLKMQLIINSENIAPCWSEFASNNEKFFDEIFVSKDYIALRSDLGCVVYSAKTGSKLKTFSNLVKIYQLPNDDIEFEEPNGLIYRGGYVG